MAKTKDTKKRTDAQSKQKTKPKKTPLKKRLVKPFVAGKNRAKNFLSRRPHRSFRKTNRRDYKRSLKLPGYWGFTGYVLHTLKKNAKLFILLGLVYALFSGLVLGLASQQTFNELRQTIQESGQEAFDGNWGEIGTAAMLTLSTVTGNLSPDLSESQQIYSVFFGLLLWLTTVWLLRNILAKNKVRLRDGLYSAGAPIVSTLALFAVLVLQLLPIALVAIAYGAALSSGLLEGGVEAMLFWIAAALLSALSLYWITSTAIALVIITLPGMYPFRALVMSGDIVVGRRLRVLYRLLWAVLLTVVVWAVVLVPTILIDAAIKNLWSAIEWLPIVPIVILVLSTASLVWIASYVYLLYRRIVEDDAAPA